MDLSFCRTEKSWDFLSYPVWVVLLGAGFLFLFLIFCSRTSLCMVGIFIFLK